jgi:hypothetical protein
MHVCTVNVLFRRVVPIGRLGFIWKKLLFRFLGRVFFLGFYSERLSRFFNVVLLYSILGRIFKNKVFQFRVFLRMVCLAHFGVCVGVLFLCVYAKLFV